MKILFQVVFYRLNMMMPHQHVSYHFLIGKNPRLERINVSPSLRHPIF